MAVLVGATKRVRIGTAALIMPYRNPVLLARMLVTLDQFSGGRIVLGAGVGWLEEEFNVLGSYDFKKRGRVTDEYLEIFKAVCAGGEVCYRGETYAFDPVFSSPGSVQRPHPPILIGGLSNAALRRVVRHGNGWLAVSAPPEKFGSVWSCWSGSQPKRAGRSKTSPSHTRRSSVSGKRSAALRCARARHRLLAEITDDIKRLFDLGFTEDHRALSRQQRRRPDESARPLRDRDRPEGVSPLRATDWGLTRSGGVRDASDRDGAIARQGMTRCGSR